MTRQVFEQRDLQAVIGHDHVRLPMVTQLATPMHSPLVLTFQTEGAQLTSPP